MNFSSVCGAGRRPSASDEGFDLFQEFWCNMKTEWAREEKGEMTAMEEEEEEEGQKEQV